MDTEPSPARLLYDRFAKDRRDAFAVGVLLLFVGLVLSRVPPLVIGTALDSLLLENTPFTVPLVPPDLLPSNTPGQVALVVGALGVSAILEVAAKWLGRLIYETASLETLHDVRTTAFSVAIELPAAATDGENAIVEDRLSVIHDDASNLTRLFDGVRDGVLYGGNLVSAFLFMLLLNWNLAVILVVLPLAIAATGRVYARLLEPRYETVRESVGELNTDLRDAIEGQATVRVYNRQARENERIASASKRYRDAKWSAVKLRAIYNRVSWLIAAVGIWGLFAFGSYWILSGPVGVFTVELTPGVLLTFILYTFSFLDPTRRIAVDVVDALQDGRASAGRVADLLTAGETAREESGGEALRVSEGALSYEDVSYRYPGADSDALADVSFELPGTGYYGVVGPSGAGKSTLLALLYRFRDPTSGTIRVDGQDVERCSLDSLRSHLGYVSQNPSLFPGTAYENIAYANPDVGLSAVRDAASDAGVDDFVRSLEDGYDTRIGEHGANLSGGQRQRIAIARALVRDPEIVVLDEAMSHVDNRTSIEILEQLFSIAEDRVVISISHRVPAVRHADHILVMDDGRIVERGTHEELLENEGTYSMLWNTQTGELAQTPSDRITEEGVER